MKKLAFFTVIIALLMVAAACNSGSTSKNETPETDGNTASEVLSLKPEKIYVAYFHGTRRCPTCIAVGQEALNAVQEFYSGDDRVEFVDIDIDKESYSEIAEKYEVSGSALLIIHNEKYENLTGFGFQNARSRPEVFRERIRELTESFLNSE